MRVVGRYFAIGATLGSVSSLVALVLIWTWMTVHLGLFGFLIGWIPAGLAAAALWLTMVVFWGPILIVCAMISIALLVIRSHPGRGWASHESPAISEPEASPAPADAEAPRDAAPSIAREPEDEAPAGAAPQPPSAPSVEQPAVSAPPSNPEAQAPPAPKTRPSDDLGGDAAAAGDTSRKPPR